MLIFLLSMQSFMKNMKKQWKDCLEGEHEEIDTQNCRINQQQVWLIWYIRFQKETLIILSVSNRNPPRTPPRPVLSNFQSKKKKKNQWFSWPDLKIWRAGNTTNLISLLEICRNFQLIHHWWTTSYFRRRKINSNCDHKSSFFGYFHFKNHQLWFLNIP